MDNTKFHYVYAYTPPFSKIKSSGHSVKYHRQLQRLLTFYVF